jgi:hypothetical protein
MKKWLCISPFTTGVALICVLMTAPTSAQAQGWTQPEPVAHSPGVASPPSATTGGLHRIDIIYTGADRRMYHQWSAGGPLNVPVDIGFVGTSSQPSVVANGRHKLDVFYRGADQHLWTRWVDDNGNWTPGVSLGGGKLTSVPFALANGLHKLDVFYAGTDGALYVSWWDGGDWWSAPEKISNETLMKIPAGPGIPPWMVSRLPRWAPVAVAGGPHKVDVVYIVPVAGRTYGRLRTVWSQGPNSTLTGSWSLPMNLNDPGGAPVPDVGFVNSSLGAAYGLAIGGKRQAHLFFTEIVDGLAHTGELRHIAAEESQPWVDATIDTVAGGSAISAVTINEVFMVAHRSSVHDFDHIEGLSRTCYLRNPLSAPEKAENCLQLPPP